jgi:hypothetical protein
MIAFSLLTSHEIDLESRTHTSDRMQINHNAGILSKAKISDNLSQARLEKRGGVTLRVKATLSTFHL